MVIVYGIGNDCCLILDGLKKNYREAKGAQPF